MARRLAGERMAELCREFVISGKTGYKIFDRYQECGIQGLTDRRRRPYRYANQLPYILNVNHEHASWEGSRHRTLWVGLRVGNFGVRRVSRLFPVALWSAGS